MTTCNSCVLTENFPGIKLNDKGVCNYCVDYKKIDHLNKKLEYKNKFELLVKSYKGKSSYDALMLYSGGKDSTYTLAILKEIYGVSVLALTFDNGFLPTQTLANIHNVVEQLGVDHMIFKPRFDVLAKIFRYCTEHQVYPLRTLERTSAICNSCMGIIKYYSLRLAVEKEIPFIVFGWSPGQVPITSSIMRHIPKMVKSMQKTIYGHLSEIVGDDLKNYFLEDKHFTGSYKFPFNIHPLVFLDYNIDAIQKSISSLNWKRPEDIDANSTNCILNSYANFVHKQRLGFHPYAFELANLVREGSIDRITALRRLSEPEPSGAIAFVKEKLHLI